MLSLIKATVEQLPLELLHQQSALLLLPLVTRLVNDDATECRAAVTEALTALIRRTCGQSATHPGEADAAKEKLLTQMSKWHGDASHGPWLPVAASQLRPCAVWKWPVRVPGSK